MNTCEGVAEVGGTCGCAVMVQVAYWVVSEVGANVVDVTVGALVVSVGTAVLGGCVVEVGA